MFRVCKWAIVNYTLIMNIKSQSIKNSQNGKGYMLEIHSPQVEKYYSLKKHTNPNKSEKTFDDLLKDVFESGKTLKEINKNISSLDNSHLFAIDLMKDANDVDFWLSECKKRGAKSGVNYVRFMSLLVSRGFIDLWVDALKWVKKNGNVEDIYNNHNMGKESFGCIETWLMRLSQRQNSETLKVIDSFIKEVRDFAIEEGVHLMDATTMIYDLNISKMAVSFSRYEDRKWAHDSWDGVCKEIIAPIIERITKKKVKDVFGSDGKYKGFGEGDKVLYLLNKCQFARTNVYMPAHMHEKYISQKINILVNHDAAFKKVTELLDSVPKEYIRMATSMDGMYVSKGMLDIWWSGVERVFGDDKRALVKTLQLFEQEELANYLPSEINKISGNVPDSGISRSQAPRQIKNAWVENKKLEIEFLKTDEQYKSKRKTI
jgi:hypothetical protein